MTWRTSRVAVRDRLDRLAWHFNWSLTQLVEERWQLPPSMLLRASCRALRSRRTATLATRA
jgi:hypothetical protein